MLRSIYGNWDDDEEAQGLSEDQQAEAVEKLASIKCVCSKCHVHQGQIPEAWWSPQDDFKASLNRHLQSLGLPAELLKKHTKKAWRDFFKMDGLFLGIEYTMRAAETLNFLPVPKPKTAPGFFRFPRLSWPPTCMMKWSRNLPPGGARRSNSRQFLIM